MLDHNTMLNADEMFEGILETYEVRYKVRNECRQIMVKESQASLKSLTLIDGHF